MPSSSAPRPPSRGRRVPAARAGFALLAAALCASACTGGHPGPQPPAAIATQEFTPGARTPPPTDPGDWLTYHHDAQRTGSAPGVPPPSALARAWATRLDGAVYGQPLVVRGSVIAATENDSVYRLDLASGRILWRAHLGTPAPLHTLPCGDIDPLGITSTPVYEPTTGLVFVLAELDGGRHLLAGLDPASGTVRVRREVEPPHGDPGVHQQRGALATVDGRVLVGFGGLEGDCGDYVGALVSVAATGAGPVLSYAVPTSRQAGIWAPGGAVVTPAAAGAGNGAGPKILVSVGNGAATGGGAGGYDGSDSVLALAPSTLTRTDFFAPATWAADNAADLDLGSLTPALVGDRFVLAVGKRGTGYTLDRGHLGGVGGELHQAPLCSAYGSAAVTEGTVFLPCADAVQRVDLDASGMPRTGWSFPLRAAGSPVLGGGAVWVPDCATGTLFALDQATGRVLARATTEGPLPHFASPVLTGGRVLLGTGDGVVAFSGA
ncbi:outer membrane protein assembly factor BamB family protein [Streptacidiphilus rugosus]|uniref:outer membrane protein assembly factor BamB family protein n=1 Tax=Streptacidiphilus rugosus TaxID=405783 RepID=UPI00068FE4C2|nr:PQQ-binding-like beta-propeller repeat protein [Streptacidiphilus rugosus]